MYVVPNKDFIEAIKLCLPEGKKVVPFLMDILSLGKEAIYRRVHGEVSFSLDEALIIAKNLHISIDQLIPQKAIFEFNLAERGAPDSSYFYLLRKQYEYFKRFRHTDNGCIYVAFSTIPYTFFLDYELISKFQLYKSLFSVWQKNELYSISFVLYIKNRI